MDMWRRALRENRRAIVAFVVWAVVSMMALSLSYGLGYLVHIPLRGLPSWALVTAVYGLAMAAGLIAGNAALWAPVIVVREHWRPGATPGLVARALACCVGGDIGFVAGEYAKSALLRIPPELTPLGPALVGGAWLGMLFFLLRLSVGYAARYRRLRQATRFAQGQVLANQLKPHFLFNSMNSLAELIETDAKQGAEMAQRLSELFRRISSGAKHATMPLSAELGIVREYLEIEKVRLGDRLSYDVEEPSWSTQRHVPTLMLQTLVENAIKHGIAPSIEGGKLRVSFRERDDGLYECTVFNTGMALQRGGDGEGTGLANTEDRLRQLYGDDCTLTLTADADGTRASFWFTGEALAQNLGLGPQPPAVVRLRR
jgi:hypothetical protein